MKTILTTLLIASTLLSGAELRQALRLPLTQASKPPITPTFKFSRITAEQKIIALTILGEARGEGEKGMYAVACVIQERMINRKRSGVAICTQYKQFSCWNGVNDLSHLFNGSKQHSYSLKLARHMTAGKKLDRKYVNFADHYCTLKTNPYWAKGKKPVKIVGNHKFFKLN